MWIVGSFLVACFVVCGPCRAFAPPCWQRHFPPALHSTKNGAENVECLEVVSGPSLTVIIPAYNEVDRIGTTLSSYLSFLQSSNRWKHGKILVVDDGSEDGTFDLVKKWNVGCVRLPTNQGKGSAVAFGIEHVASSQEQAGIILVADADGSGEISCLDACFDKLESTLEVHSLPIDDAWNKPALVVGNRGYQGVSLARAVLRWGFRTAVSLICGELGVQDSQCGFKLMTLAAARLLYSELNLQGWTHDVEVLYRARLLGIPVGEQTVWWEDKDGSKLVTSPGGTIGVSMTMLVEILRMRIEYELGRWELPSPARQL